MYKKTNNTNPRRNYDSYGTYSNEQFDECDFERFLDEYTGSNQKSRNESPRKCHRRENEECENTINIINKICINQKADAEGGDGGDGGDTENGNVTGGSAAAATGLIAIAANVTDPEIEIPLSDDLVQKEQEELEAEQANGSGTVATGGSATIGTSTGGNGGNGGNGTASNSSSITINQTIAISITCNSDTPSGVRIGTADRTLDIEVDENGDTFVNGEKLDDKELSDGTKVLIFKSSQSEKA